MNDNETLATAFTALSHKRRVLIFKELQENESGLSYGALMARTGLSSTTLNHHLRPMIAAGLVERKVKGSFSFHVLRPVQWMQIIASIGQPALAKSPSRFLRKPPPERPTA